MSLVGLNRELLLPAISQLAVVTDPGHILARFASVILPDRQRNTMSFEGLPDGWQLWSSEATKAVLAYRPDIFDTSDLPAACMPTIYLTKGKRSRRPGRDVPAPDAAWYVTLYLEPEVDAGTDEYDSREAAERAAIELAAQFDAGDIEYRSLYQVPRPEYLDRLDVVTERET